VVAASSLGEPGSAVADAETEPEKVMEIRPATPQIMPSPAPPAILDYRKPGLSDT
jgi:hypothetical protein